MLPQVSSSMYAKYIRASLSTTVELQSVRPQGLSTPTEILLRSLPSAEALFDCDFKTCCGRAAGLGLDPAASELSCAFSQNEVARFLRSLEDCCGCKSCLPRPAILRRTPQGRPTRQAKARQDEVSSDEVPRLQALQNIVGS